MHQSRDDVLYNTILYYIYYVISNNILYCIISPYRDRPLQVSQSQELILENIPILFLTVATHFFWSSNMGLSDHSSLIENLHYPHEYGSEWVPVVVRRKQYPSENNLIWNVTNTFANKMSIQIKVEYSLS